MWIILALCSALGLGCYDICKKRSLVDNNVLTVLFLNTLFCTLILSPVLINDVCHDFGFNGDWHCHLKLMLKAGIVLTSWTLGYFSIKHLPLTINGPINATRPILVLVGALVIFGERLNWLQWGGIILGFCSLFLVSKLGKKEGFTAKQSKWLWMCLGATVMGAISGLYDKYLMKSMPPMSVQAWYSFYQCILMGSVILIIKKTIGDGNTPFHWKWSIIFISIFLTAADICYLNSLKCDGAMIAVVSMIRRGSVLVSFMYGIIVLKERNIKMKLLDLSLLFIGLIMLVLGSY